MRRLIKSFARVNALFWFLNLIFSLGYMFCVFTPLSMIGLSPIICTILALLLFFLDSAIPVAAWIVHLVVWIISINFALKCQIPNLLTLYIVCAAVYVLFEIICTGVIVLSGRKHMK